MHMSKVKDQQERVRFVQVDSIAAQIEHVYQNVRSRIKDLLPESDCRHIGATSIPKSLSKGDLDVLVMVKSAYFTKAELILSKHFKENIGTEFTTDFHSFVSIEYPIDVGIQLKSEESKWPCFLQWQKLLLEDEEVHNEYDELKRSFEGKLMSDYRQAKEVLICRYFPVEK